ncbi:MAG: adenine nucleotide alpha hydrolase [Alphaproteobacteria bacterium]|nr:adenine nucleotide alpha hydrolase [Alphaproteobacteria bacterium]MDP6588155.1 adenine nucleotide alpha hydrolase [Alphaproteobacteria bacterium]MDP6816524.1 adenine nucleotide alpha hydrolase [Alphaproteobacteria bacterium]
MTELAALEHVLGGIGRAAIAVSGGIDSMTLATVAGRLAGHDHTVFHALSPAVPLDASERVRRHAAREGWKLREIDAGEFDDPNYRANPVDRCFYCKTNLYDSIAAVTDDSVLSGTNLDDLGDYRPGLEAARRHGVRHPFVEAGIDKAAVRAIARHLALGDLAELPAAPCLSSRVETGLRIEGDQLALIDAVEKYVARRLDAHTVRCRIRREKVVIELDASSLAALGDLDAVGISHVIAVMLQAEGIDKPLNFRPYRMGSAFLRPEAHG